MIVLGNKLGTRDRVLTGRLQFGRMKSFLAGSTQQLSANCASYVAESMTVTDWKPGNLQGTALPFGMIWLLSGTYPYGVLSEFISSMLVPSMSW